MILIKQFYFLNAVSPEANLLNQNQVNTSELDFEINIIIKMGLQEINCENYSIEYMAKHLILYKGTVCYYL